MPNPEVSWLVVEPHSWKKKHISQIGSTFPKILGHLPFKRKPVKPTGPQKKLTWNFVKFGNHGVFLQVVAQ